MEYSLVINYFYPVSSDSTSLFFRIEQELEDNDPLSVDEVAQAIDAVTGQDFCNRTVAKNGYKPPENKSPAEQQVAFRVFFSEKLSDPLIAQDFAQRLGIEQPCKAASGEPITIPLKVFWQTLEIAENYRLASTAKVDFSKPVFVRENLEKEFNVSEAIEKNIEYYIDINKKIYLWHQIEFKWVGNVVDENKNIISGPLGISIKNNSIVKWGQRVSGTFVIKFKTLYHLVNAKITPTNSGYSATVYGAWDGPAVSLDLVVPEKAEDEKCPIKNLLNGEGTVGDVTIDGDDSEEEASEVTCFWLTTHKLRQPCGDNKLIDRWETIDRVKCPDGIADRTITLNSPMSLGYISEIKSRYYYKIGDRTIPKYISTSDPRFNHDCEECTEDGFQEACCRKRASVGGIMEPIPPCLGIKSTFYGGIEIEKGREYWKEKYPGGVTFQEKLPKDGYCGLQTVVFGIKNCDPCKNASELHVETELSVTVITEGSDGDIYFGGGKPPYQISLSGQGFYLNAEHTVTDTEITDTVFTVHTNGSCGTCTVTVTDDCDQSDTHKIRSSEGVWVVSESYGDTTGSKTTTCTVDGVQYRDFWELGYNNQGNIPGYVPHCDYPNIPADCPTLPSPWPDPDYTIDDYVCYNNRSGARAACDERGFGSCSCFEFSGTNLNNLGGVPDGMFCCESYGNGSPRPWRLYFSLDYYVKGYEVLAEWGCE